MPATSCAGDGRRRPQQRWRRRALALAALAAGYPCGGAAAAARGPLASPIDPPAADACGTPGAATCRPEFIAFRFAAPRAWALDGAAALVAKADELACFGWVQQPRANPQSMVGEARCRRDDGLELLVWLIDRAGDELDYRIDPSGRIKLHFERFKILPGDRLTCFAEPPHQCEHEALLDAQSVSEDIIWPREQV